MKKISFFFFFFYFQLQAQPWQPLKDTESFKKKLNATNAQTQSMQCNFTQEKNLTFMAQKVYSKGVMWYKKPDKLRLSYNQPFSYEMVITGTKVLFKDKGKISKVDAGNNKLFKYVNDLMMNSMKGEVLNNTDFNYQFKESPTHIRIEMKPLKQVLLAYIEQINLIFSKSDMQLLSMEMLEKGGDSTLIRYTNRLINKEFSDEVFKIQ